MKEKKIYVNKLFVIACLAVTFLVLENNFSTNEKVPNPIREIERLL